MDVNDLVKSTGLRRKATLNVTFCVKKERNASFKKVSRILQKSENDRTEEEKEVLSSCSDVVKEVTSRLEKRKVLKARSEEVEDCADVLERKCEVLARAVERARHLVVYSGAGVSTAACIPDYRGSNGIWTRLQQGLDIGNHDLSKTEPTLTHMALYYLYRRGMLKHVVSQNCDGLHLRSGLPRAALSEVHGNMYLEVCQLCKVEYWRLFDVTEHTARYAHATARRCYVCHKPLRDTIVHFGERGALKWPLNWSGATAAANQADVILCIGSSLKVLKKYPWLWGMDRPVKKRPSLYIVNLQWTPKDEQAALKINGKCDEVMALVMAKLGLPIPEYDSQMDPIFVHATQLHTMELHTYSTAALEAPGERKRATTAEPGAGGGDGADKRPCNDASKCESPTTNVSEAGDGVGRENNFCSVSSSNITGKMCDKVTPTPNVVETVEVSCEQSDCYNLEIKQEVGSSKDVSGSGAESEENFSKFNFELALEKAKKEDVVDDMSQVITKREPDRVGLQISDVGVKEEPSSDSLPGAKLKEDPKLDEPCKSPTKGQGFWRPFLFDDNGKPSSSSCVAHAVEIKTEPGLQDSTKLASLPKFQNQPGFSKENSDVQTVKGMTEVSLVTDPKKKNAIRCNVQSEPLDLSCSRKSEVKDHPYFCKYCRAYYHSGFCLFYRKHFSEVPPDPPCYCCDEEDEKDEKDPTSPEVDSKSAEDSDKSSSKASITNPGWFGKGYRKKIRKKR